MLLANEIPLNCFTRKNSHRLLNIIAKNLDEIWKMCFIPKPYDESMNKSLLAIIAIIVIGAGAVFAVSPYFTESTVDEALPTGAIIQSEIENDENMFEEPIIEFETMMEEIMEEETMMEEIMEEETMMEEIMEEETMMEEIMEEETMMEEIMEEETMMEEITPISYAGIFTGVGDGVHDAQGDVYTIPIEDGSNVLRLENFQSTNGPDLFVYLATDDMASEFVNLGDLKANNGNQNYDIPEGTDLSKYNKVLIWCKAFGVLFGSAELSS